MYVILCFICLLSACSSSPGDYKEVGRSKVYELLLELKKIKNREELMDSALRLERCYDEIAEVMILAKMHSNKITELTEEDHALSEKVRLELSRIHRLEGGREILEKCQRKAVEKLEAAM